MLKVKTDYHPFIYGNLGLSGMNETAAKQKYA